MERRLREILSESGPQGQASAEPAFAARLRAQFVAGEFEAERVLGGSPPAAADPEFKTELRGRFLAAGGAAATEPSGGVDAAAAGLREALEETPARGGFKSRLRAQFVLGSLDREEADRGAAAPAVGSGPAKAGQDATAIEPAPELAPVHSLEAGRRRWGPLVAAAVAAVALFAFVLPTALGPDWRVHRAPAEANTVLFNRAPVAPEGERLDVDTGRILACGAEALRLSLDNRAQVEIEPNSQIRFCAPMFRLFDSSLAPVHLDRGEVNLRTLEERDVTLRVDTPNAIVRLEDGAVSIRATDAGTCIVVLEGEVEVISDLTGERRVVTSDDRLWVSRCGQDCRLETDLMNSTESYAVERTEAARAMLVDIEAGVF